MSNKHFHNDSSVTEEDESSHSDVPSEDNTQNRKAGLQKKSLVLKASLSKQGTLTPLNNSKSPDAKFDLES